MSSRVGNGSAANYLNTNAHGTFSGASTNLAWVKPASIGNDQTIFGNSYDAGMGWRINASGRLEVFWSNGPTYDANKLSVPLLAADGASEDLLIVGTPLFVAINITNSVFPNVSADFYAGFTPSTVQLLGTAAGGPSITPNGVQHVAIFVNMWGVTPQHAFDGNLQRIGRYQGTNLNLAQLQAIAVCGATPPSTNLQFFYEITGSDPEPDSGPSGLDATVIGSLPLDVDLCDGVAPDNAPSPHFLLTVDRVWRTLEYHYLAAPQPPTSLDPRLMILDALTLLPIIEIEAYTDLNYVKSWTELDRFDCKIGAQTFDGLRLKSLGIVPSAYDYILMVLINNVFDFGGIVQFTSIDIENGKDVYTLKGNGVDQILADKLAIPPAGSDTDSYNDIAENVMRALVDVNLINPQHTDVLSLNEAQRTILLLDQTPNLSAGATVTVEARNQTVFEAVREAALQDGELGFQILIVAGQFLFDVFSGVDRSANVVFALDRDNLKKQTVTYDKSNYTNWLIMAGAGNGATRVVFAALAPTGGQGIKRKERFQDARELTTGALLQERGKAILATEADFVSIVGDRMPISYPQYKIDFELGDIVTFSAPDYGLAIAKRVVEVEVSMSEGRPFEVRITLGKAKSRQSKMILRNSLQATSRS